MVCYVITLAAAVFVHIAGKSKHSPCDKQLELLLAGGAIFGVIDHLWNGQLFLISNNWLWDLALGIVITASIFLFWSASKAFNSLSSRECQRSQNGEKVPEQ